MEGPYATTRGRRLAAVFVGAGTGGLLTIAMLMLMPTVRDSAWDHPYAVWLWLVVLILLSVAWLAGIGIFAVPFWLWLERKRALGWRAAGLWGAALAAPVSVLFFALCFATVESVRREVAGYSLPIWLIFWTLIAISFGVLGSLVGLTMWRFAYRRTINPVADVFS